MGVLYHIFGLFYKFETYFTHSIQSKDHTICNYFERFPSYRYILLDWFRYVYDRHPREKAEIFK